MVALVQSCAQRLNLLPEALSGRVSFWFGVLNGFSSVEKEERGYWFSLDRGLRVICMCVGFLGGKKITGRGSLTSPMTSVTHILCKVKKM